MRLLRDALSFTGVRPKAGQRMNSAGLIREPPRRVNATRLQPGGRRGDRRPISTLNTDTERCRVGWPRVHARQFGRFGHLSFTASGTDILGPHNTVKVLWGV